MALRASRSSRSFEAREVIRFLIGAVRSWLPYPYDSQFTKSKRQPRAAIALRASRSSRSLEAREVIRFWIGAVQSWLPHPYDSYCTEVEATATSHDCAARVTKLAKLRSARSNSLSDRGHDSAGCRSRRTAIPLNLSDDSSARPGVTAVASFSTTGVCNSFQLRKLRGLRGFAASR
jgi:hypothetical protein